jgi:hypothetical protein
VESQADTLDVSSELFGGFGVERVAWYGVRLFTEGCTLDRSAMDPEELVWWLSSRPAAAMPTGNSAGCSTSSEAAAAASSA